MRDGDACATRQEYVRQVNSARDCHVASGWVCMKIEARTMLAAVPSLSILENI